MYKDATNRNVGMGWIASDILRRGICKHMYFPAAITLPPLPVGIHLDLPVIPMT